MKYKVSILATTLCLLVNTACAQDLKSELRPDSVTRSAEKPSMVKKETVATYGAYRLNADLIAVPQALANRDVSTQDIANMTLVQRSTSADLDQVIEFRRNSVVRNNMTGEMGVVTGNISLLAKPGSDINSLIRQLDLRVVRSASVTGVYVVQPRADIELLSLLEQIKASELVSTARLDILERKYSNQ